MIEKLPKKWSRHSFIAFGEIIKDHIYVSNVKNHPIINAVLSFIPTTKKQQ